MGQDELKDSRHASETASVVDQRALDETTILMHFKDLTPYEFYLSFKLTDVLNVGWLTSDSCFEKRAPSRFLVDKLTNILLSDDPHEFRVNPIRCVHSCNLCGAHEFSTPFIGSCELWIPAGVTGGYFAAPSLIIHYIEAHHYRPPEDFDESVINLDLKAIFNAQQVYDDLVQAYSADI